jgi:hypothetical protein
MGCGNPKVEVKEEDNQNQNQNQKKIDANIPYQDIITDSEYKKFKDMEETTKDRYIGEGIMRIHNYKCPLPIDKLESLRQQFWLTRNQTDNNWKILKTCIGLDVAEAEKYLEENNIICLQNSIQNTYNKLQPNYIYHLPNFIVCDPIYEKEYVNYEEVYDSVEDTNLNLKLYYVTKGITYQVKIRNKDTGFDIIHKFMKLSKVDNRLYVIRVFYGGQEIEETHCVYYHQVKDGDTLQILTTERGETVNTYSKIVSRKTEKRLGIMEKLKRIENGEDVEDEISNSYYENVLTTGNQDGEKEGSDNYDKKIKKKKKGKKKKKKKGTNSIKEENDENEEDVKEKRW